MRSDLLVRRIASRRVTLRRAAPRCAALRRATQRYVRLRSATQRCAALSRSATLRLFYLRLRSLQSARARPLTTEQSAAPTGEHTASKLSTATRRRPSVAPSRADGAVTERPSDERAYKTLYIDDVFCSGRTGGRMRAISRER